MTPKQRELINRVTISLEAEPHKWRRDEFHAEHDSGLRIWIANGCAWLGIWGSRGNRLAAGDMVMLGSLVPWRRRLLRAAMAIPLTERNELDEAIEAI